MLWGRLESRGQHGPRRSPNPLWLAESRARSLCRPQEFSPTLHYDTPNETGAHLTPRGHSGGGGGLLQGSGGSAELPQPHRRQGVCIFIGVPESVILLRAERLIQLSC